LGKKRPINTSGEGQIRSWVSDEAKTIAPGGLTSEKALGRKRKIRRMATRLPRDSVGSLRGMLVFTIKQKTERKKKEGRKETNNNQIRKPTRVGNEERKMSSF